MKTRFRLGTLLWLLAASTAFAQSQQAAVPLETAKSGQVKKVLVYKKVDGVQIEADVYVPKGPGPHPVLAWFHGGALMMGKRGDVPNQWLELGAREGILVVSFDYRLIPETKLPAVIDDVRDALTWIRTSGPELFQADPKRLVVSGASAGGYLALMSGFIIDPPPTAIASFWGFGEIDGEWSTKPNEAFLKGPQLSDEEAWALVGDNVPTNTDGTIGKKRWDFFIHLKQKGTWAKVATGWDPAKEPDKFTPFCPIRNLSASYPPTLFVHGTNDTDVPYERSVEMAKALERIGRPQRLITIKGGGHGGWGGDPNVAKQAFEDSFEYVRKQLKE